MGRGPKDLAGRHALAIEFDLCLAIDSGHVEHGLAVVGQDKLIKPLVSGVLAVERLAREAESTISPDVSSGVRSPSLSQKSALMPQADAQ